VESNQGWCYTRDGGSCGCFYGDDGVSYSRARCDGPSTRTDDCRSLSSSSPPPPPGGQLSSAKSFPIYMLTAWGWGWAPLGVKEPSPAAEAVR
jgi:hypothetical protein